MEEILMDILSRLSEKSVIRFNCVSKFWNVLISQSYFKKKHFNHGFKKKHFNHGKNKLSSTNMIFVYWDEHKSQWSLLSDNDDIPIFDYCNTNPTPIDGVKIFCNCDGLFLIGISTDRNIEQPAGLVIWDPSTHQSIRLPHTKYSEQIGYDNNDEGDKGSTYGMAYDSNNDEIDISGKNDDEILALKNGSWRIIDGKTSGRTDRRRLLRGREFLAFVDGAFHWIGFLSKVCVISFNILDEMYGEISLPDIISSKLTLSQFVKGRLEVDIHEGVSELRGMLGVYHMDNCVIYVLSPFHKKLSSLI